MLTWIVILLSLTYILWKVAFRKFQYFKEHGIPYISAVPLLGSTWKTLVNQMPYQEWMLEYTHKFRKHRFYGLSNFGTLSFMIQGPGINHTNKHKRLRKFFEPSGNNHNWAWWAMMSMMIANSLSVLRFQSWKVLSPAFTGSKMKMIQTIFGQIKLIILQMFPRLGKRLGFSMTKREFNTS